MVYRWSLTQRTPTYGLDTIIAIFDWLYEIQGHWKKDFVKSKFWENSHAVIGPYN